MMTRTLAGMTALALACVAAAAHDASADPLVKLPITVSRAALQNIPDSAKLPGAPWHKAALGASPGGERHM